MSDREEQARASIETFNRGDWDGLRALVAPDLVYEETGTGRRVEGVDTVVDALVAWRAAFSDVIGEVTRVLVDGDTTVLEIVWRGTQDGPLETAAGVLPASGRSLECWATLWQRWEGDVIVHERHHLDVLTMMAQIGALPAQPAPAGR